MKKMALALAIVLVLTGCAETWVARDTVPAYTQLVEYNKQGAAGSRQETNNFVTYAADTPLPTLQSEYVRSARGSAQLFSVVNEGGQREYVGFQKQFSQKSGVFGEATHTLTCFRRSATTMDGVCGMVVRFEETPNLAEAVQRFNDGEEPLMSDTWLFYELPPVEFSSTGTGILSTDIDYSRAVLDSYHVNTGWRSQWFAEGVNWGRAAVVRVTHPAQSRLARFTAQSRYWEQWEDEPEGVGLEDVRLAVRAAISDLKYTDWQTPPAGEQLVAVWGDPQKTPAFLNREGSTSLTVFPGTESERIFVITPSYNREWNDIVQNYESFYSLTFRKRCRHRRTFNAHDELCREMETAGWLNSKNVALESITVSEVSADGSGIVRAFLPVRAFMGNAWTLMPVMDEETGWKTYYATQRENYLDITGRDTVAAAPTPQYIEKTGVDGEGTGEYREMSREEQDIWRRAAEEDSIFTYLANRDSIPVLVGMRMADNSEYVPVPCGDDICGYRATEYNFEAQYTFTYSDVENLKWLYAALTMPGIAGNRVLGLGYAYKPGSGTGLVPALSQALMGAYYAGETELPDEFIYFLGVRAPWMGGMPETLLDWIER